MSHDAALPIFTRSHYRHTGLRIVFGVAASFTAKCLGFVRVQQIASLLGASYYADVLLLTFQLVWLLETVLIASAVAPTLISVIYKVEARTGSEAAGRLYLHAAFWCAAASAAYGALLLLFSEQIVSVVAPGFDDQARGLFRDLMLVSFATPLCLTVSQFFSLVNRLTDNSVWYSTPQIITNVVALGGLVLGYHTYGLLGGVIGMMAGLTAGAVGVLFLQRAVIPRHTASMLWRTLKSKKLALARSSTDGVFWKSTAALVCAALVSELYVYADFYFASRAGPGGIGLISYASRLATLTNMLVVAAPFVVIETRWARSLAHQPDQAWSNTIVPDAMSLLSLLAAPVAVLIFFNSEVTSLVYYGGKFSPEEASTLRSLVRAYGFSVIGMSLSVIMARALVLQGRAGWLMRISLFTLPAKVVLSALLVPRYGLMGLPIATMGCFAIQATAYLLLLSRDAPAHRAMITGVGRVAFTFAAVFALGYGLSRLQIDHLLWVVVVAGLVGVFNLGLGVAVGFSYSRLAVRAFSESRQVIDRAVRRVRGKP